MDIQLVPIEDLAKHFMVSVSTVRAWVRQGLIPDETYIKVGGTYRFCIPKVVKHFMEMPKTDKSDLTDADNSVGSSTAPEEEDTPVQLELDFTPDQDI